MNWSNVKLILGREIRDQLRDRRTLFVIAILPLLLYPLLGMSFFQVSQFLQERPTRVLVVGAENLNGLPTLVEENRFAADLFPEPEKARLQEVELAPASASKEGLEAQWVEAVRQVQEAKVDVALFFPSDFAKQLEAFRLAIQNRSARPAREPAPGNAESQPAHEVPSPKVYYSKASERSTFAYVRLMDPLTVWIQRIGQENLQAGGVPAQAAKPFEISTVEGPNGPAPQGAAVWAKIFPVLLLIWALTGAFYPAVDLCAGEKERGTLETLLCSPAERTEIVLGKLLTIMLFSMATALLNVLCMAATGWVIVRQIPGLGAPPLAAMLWLPVALVPISALFSALCLAMAAFARSTKEGQYYLMPLLLITTPLVVLPMAPGVELNLGNSLIPVSGVVLLLRSVLQGNYIQAAQFAPPVILVTGGGCLLAIRWAVDQFNSESVLFRESERFGLGLWLRRLLHDRQPTPTVAGAIFCGVLILMVRFFMGLALPQPADFEGFARLTLATQLVVIALPAMLGSVLLTNNPAQTLLLRWPPWLTVPAAAALAVVFQPTARLLQEGVVRLYPVNPAMEHAMKGFQGMFQEAPTGHLVFVIALAPAICEELAFRGFILSGFRHLGHRWRAIIYSSIFFGLVHTILQQSIAACIVGMVIGLIAVQSGSILPAMVFHLVHNSLTLLSSRLPADAVNEWPVLGLLMKQGAEGQFVFNWSAVGLSAALSLLLILWFNRLPHPKSAEEQFQEAIEKKAAASKQ